MLPAPGDTIGGFEVVRVLGRGGMASVFEAHERGLERRVALKVLHTELLEDPSFAERFQREARFVALLEHPHIVPIYGCGIDGGVPWMSMRMLSGGSLQSLLARGQLDQDRTLALLRDVAQALDFAHRRGIVHRDVKPQNILLDEDGTPYLADFGIARLVASTHALTQTGVVVGTPTYMAPEQAEGAHVDHHCDIYALGVIAYQMLVGHVPFAAETPVALMFQHVRKPVPLPPPDCVSPETTEALLTCLAKRPEDRWPTAEAFVRALQRSRVGPTVPVAAAPDVSEPAAPVPPPSPPSRGRWLLAAAAAAIAVTGAIAVAATIVLLRDARPEGPRAAASSPPTLAPSVAPPATTVASTPPVSVVVPPVPTTAPPTTVPPATRPLPPSPTSHAVLPPPAPSVPPPSPVTVPAGTRLNPRDLQVYASIPAGSFQMGCVSGDPLCDSRDEQPHRVEIGHAFWLGRTEYTVGAYKRFAAATGRPMPPAPPYDQAWSMDTLPVVHVSWSDAVAACEWSGGRLPTEAEWEYAARGGREGTVFPWGNDAPSCTAGAAAGAAFGACGTHSPSPVGSFAPNGMGLLDMAGNVWEWCRDWYREGYYATSPGSDPAGPSEGEYRVVRGGGWSFSRAYLRLSYRNRAAPADRTNNHLGFRCALDGLR